MLHDYHLYTAPKFIREARPDAVPPPLRPHPVDPARTPGGCCPRDMREDIFEGILSNDIIAFHTRSYRRNFLLCCRELFDLDVDEEAGRGALRRPRGVGALLPAADLRRGLPAQRPARRRSTSTSARSCAAGAST